MTNPNGSLPDFLLIYSPTTGWYITDHFGNLFFNNANISLDSKLRMLNESGANYQVIDPRKHQRTQR